LFAKAIASECDAVCFDLEDSVHPGKKADARFAVAAFLRSGDRHRKVTVVRVNSRSTNHFAQDAEALADAEVDIINLPKVESGEDIMAAGKSLQPRAALLANIETPKGLRLAHEIAAAHSSVLGLQIGYTDLFGMAGVDRRDAIAVAAVQLRVRFAAAEAGIAAYDGAFLDVNDLDGLRTEAQAARRHGLAGKSCIHPKQVAIVNEVFSPRAEEVDWARRVLAAADAEGNKGVFVAHGEMVDQPVIARARAVIALAERAGNAARGIAYDS
jgi:citrate lyase subunit beta/citryl-CoA lyase